MPSLPKAIVDADALMITAKALIDHLDLLEKELQRLMDRGINSPKQQERVVMLNKNMQRSIRDATTAIHRANLAIQFTQNKQRKQNSGDAQISPKQMQVREDILSRLSKRLSKTQAAILVKIHAPTTDPLHEMLKSAPSPSNVDPNIVPIVSALFDNNGILQRERRDADGKLEDNLIQKELAKLNEEGKTQFLTQLAKHILDTRFWQQTGKDSALNYDHRELNIRRAFSQLPISLYKNEFNEFKQQLQIISKDLGIELLQTIHAPTKLPRYAHDDMLHVKPTTIVPTNPKILTEYEEQVQRLARKPFQEVKNHIKTLPDRQQRLDFMAAVREEVENNKLKDALDGIEMPAKTPKPR